MPSNNIVFLSTNNELAKLARGVHGSKKYKIISNYLLDLFLDKKILLSDGRIAIIDKRDAAHIAHKSGDKRIAEVSKLKSIVDEATYFSSDNNVYHRKFDKFLYYKTMVRLDNEVYNVFLNVGRARNNGVYHIYDITRKIRESAHR